MIRASQQIYNGTTDKQTNKQTDGQETDGDDAEVTEAESVTQAEVGRKDSGTVLGRKV